MLSGSLLTSFIVQSSLVNQELGASSRDEAYLAVPIIAAHSQLAELPQGLCGSLASTLVDLALEPSKSIVLGFRNKSGYK